MQKITQKIIPHLWFDKGAKEATAFYATLLPDSKVTKVTTITGTPSGDCDIVEFQMAGQSLMAISAGPYFKLNPSISFFINFDPAHDAEAEKRIDQVWEKLSKEGKVLMPLQAYPFSKKYGWIQDRYGVSWQLILSNPDGEPRPVIVPSLMFTGAVAGKAEEATDFYLSVFANSKRGTIARYSAGATPDKEGSIMFTDFRIKDTWFAAMDSALPHGFVFNEAISLVLTCETQEELDDYWAKLSAVPQSEQCGWCKDKYGVSWQIVPRILGELMTTGTPEQKNRVTQAFLKMKKFDIAALKAAFK